MKNEQDKKIIVKCPSCGENIVIDKSRVPKGMKIEVECEKCGAIAFVKI